jgi:Protein of unknown function (DUF2475)
MSCLIDFFFDYLDAFVFLTMFSIFPGYTGYVPRAREHFGQPYSVTTSAALADFSAQCEGRSRVPEKLAAIVAAAHDASVPSNDASQLYAKKQPPLLIPAPFTSPPVSPDGVISVSSQLGRPQKHDRKLQQNTTGYVAAQQRKHARAAELLAQCPNASQMFVPGYTGFIPGMRERHGEQFQRAAAQSRKHTLASVCVPASAETRAVTVIASAAEHYRQGGAETRSATPRPRLEPIPGYTGFVPLSKYAYARSFAARNEQHLSPPTQDALRMPQKDLATSASPIPGYRGFVPIYQMHGQRAFGPTSKFCIAEHKQMTAASASNNDARITEARAAHTRAAAARDQSQVRDHPTHIYKTIAH